MKILDNKTLDRIADIICGDKLLDKYCDGYEGNCAYYRKGYQLSEFFQDAGLHCEDHDGSTRKWWTVDRLKEYNDNYSEIEKILLRLASPKEYGDKKVADNIIKELNDIIYGEDLKIRLQGSKPEITVLDLSNEEKKDNKTIEKVQFSNLITDDPNLLIVLESRWNEIEVCISNEAYLSTIILLGSILEGVLLFAVEKNPKNANQANSAPKDKLGNILRFKDWNLINLINVTHQCKWIDKDIKDFNSSLRDYRNLVHPRKQRDEDVFPDYDTCRICLEVVRAAINDLNNNLKKN